MPLLMIKTHAHCVTFFLLVLLSSHSPLSGQATQYPDVPPLLLGAAWYPEQWDEATWKPDSFAKRKAAHIHLARVGEFAWSTMEPARGQVRLRVARPRHREGRRPPHRIVLAVRRTPGMAHQ